jgi:RNA polymerase sigma-70 factor (ECF subfamily)
MGEKRASTEVEARFNAVVEKYGDFLRKTIAQVCPKDLGLNFADIEQDARVRLWRALESEREIHHLGSYIYRIAVTATISAVQRMKARREEQLRLPEEDAEAGAELVADRSRSPDALAEQEEVFRNV